MKTCYFLKKIFVLVASFLFILRCALAESPSCYVNPDGGSYYHARPDCARIAEKYWPDMVELPVSQLTEDAYSHLQPCSGCYGSDEKPFWGDNRYYFHYVSPYDTADDVPLQSTGVYQAGDTLRPGIYTAWADAACHGTLTVCRADGEPLYSYPLEGAGPYTFYLGNDMLLSVPEHCTVKKLQFNMLFQAAQQKTEIERARYITMLEVPGREYRVTNIPGKQAYCMISSIEAEIGQEPPLCQTIADGEIISINLQDRYDTFVEFVNCIVWFEDGGNG